MGKFGNQPEFATSAEAITASDTVDGTTNLKQSALYIGTGGDLSVLMAGERNVANAIVFKNLPDGVFLPIIVDHVLATGTTAADLIAIK